MRGKASWRVFVTCFCEAGDLLSQWRGYGTDHGYALGFAAEPLGDANAGELTPVQYGIADPTAHFASELEGAQQRTAHPGEVAFHISEKLLPRLARVKHPSFAEEREWRLMRQVDAVTLRTEPVVVQFRPSSLGPVPYIVNAFPSECLRGVVVGPGSHGSVRARGVREMLQYHGFADCEVHLSDVPLRR